MYVVGEVGIQDELDLVGIRHIGGPADGDKRISLKAGEFMEHDHDVGAVVVGFDRYINYYKLQASRLRNGAGRSCARERKRGVGGARLSFSPVELCHAAYRCA